MTSKPFNKSSLTSIQKGQYLLTLLETCHESMPSLADVQNLVDNGADLAQLNRNGLTALMFAAIFLPAPHVQILIPRSDIDAQEEKYKRTALMLSGIFGGRDAARALVLAGADKTLTDRYAKNAAELAHENHHFETESVIRKTVPFRSIKTTLSPV